MEILETGKTKLAFMNVCFFRVFFFKSALSQSLQTFANILKIVK